MRLTGGRARALSALALGVAALGLSAAPSVAYHSGSCSVTGLTELVDNPQAGVLDQDLEVHSYKITVGAGEHYVLVQPLNGDADIAVCKVGTTTPAHVCSSGNIANVPDTCLANGLGGNPGAGRPLIGPGSFRLTIRHCWLSGGDPGCDYDPVGPAPVTVPVAYIAVAH